MKIRNRLNNLFYSFPVQLVILHLRNNLLLLLCWIVVVMLMTGMTGRLFGIRYLFLVPEYLGRVSFRSFFILGFSFAWFFMTWNLTSYLINAHRFPFLASLSRPFTKFCLNNGGLILAFLALYLEQSIHFQLYYEYKPLGETLWNCLGFLIGIAGFVGITSLYFQFTNKDIFNFIKLRPAPAPDQRRQIGPGLRAGDLETIKLDKNRWRVDTYLSETLRPRYVRSVEHYEARLLMGVFRQNHRNALIWLVTQLVLLTLAGFLIDNPWFRIPAGASIFILFSILVALIGAITFWLNRWRVSVMILLIFGINYLTGFDIFNHKNHAYGLNYQAAAAVYQYPQLEQLCTPAQVAADKDATLRILERWKLKCQKPDGEKPKMVFFCASGGGLRAAVWAMQVIQQADSVLQGRLMRHTVLMAGASGGIMGMSYLREIYLRQRMGQRFHIQNARNINNMGKDMLNSVGFTLVSHDLFLPWSTFETGGYSYLKDRGYMLEKQLNENTEGILDKSLCDYYLPEQNAIIPMMFVTPTIVNDGRRLIISPQGVSYMMKAPVDSVAGRALEIDAVDFRKLFAHQNGDNLRFTNAIRMNATYPYILPNVTLPTEPLTEVMDAGFRDNYGILSATRFIHVFKNWIKENTSGVVIIQVTGWDKIEEIEPYDHQGAISSLLNPLGLAGSMFSLQDFELDANLGYIYELLGRSHVHVLRFVYHPMKGNERASVTLHLTRREQLDVLEAIHDPDNQAALRSLRRIMGPR